MIYAHLPEELQQWHFWRNLFKDYESFPSRRVNHDQKKKQIAIILMNEPSDTV